MRYIYLTLNWVFGLLFLLTGVYTAFVSFWSGVSFLLLAGLLLPPVRQFVYSWTNTELPVKARAVAIIVVLMLGGFFGEDIGSDSKKPNFAKKEKTEELRGDDRLAAARQRVNDDFNANRAEIIASIEKALAQENIKSALDQARKYQIVDDDKLQQLLDTAKTKYAPIRNAKRTEEIEAKLKDVPVEEYEKNLRLYKELRKLNPENEHYKDKIAFYTQNIEKKKEKERAEKERRDKIQSQFSPWDGSHRNLERFIKKNMNDPGSYDHVKTVYSDRGDHLVVQTTFRGKNAFGGVVKNSVTAKVSLDGRILEILGQQ